jgi:SAM-dependent methyltransferase
MEPAEYDLMDAAEARMWWYRALHARACDALSGVTGRVLDAGCGTGGLLHAIGRRHPALTLAGVELAKPAARRACLKSGAPVVCGSINRLPFATAAFDAVVTTDVLCHAAVDPAMALAEVHRVLRPGGRLVINLPAFQWLYSAHDRRVHNARRWTAIALRHDLQRAGFAQVYTRYWNVFLLPIMIVRRKMLGRYIPAASDVAKIPPYFDRMLHAVTAIERHLKLNPPAGSSVLATAIRPGTIRRKPP